MSPEIEAILQRSLDWIEENLRAQFSLQELSDMAGVSLSRYYRIFEAATGMSVMRYITRRRLLHAVWAMSRGMRTTDAAMEYGFDTHAGFYKAFRREFGCAPSRYLRSYRAARPERVRLKEGIRMLESRQWKKALAAWGLSEAPTAPVYYQNTGNRSESTISVGDEYFLKCSAQLGEMHRQTALMKALGAHGLAAPVVPAMDGREIVRAMDMDFVLLRRIEGRTADALRLMRHRGEARAIGEGIARLHAALRACDPILCKEEDLVATLKDWAVPAARQAMPTDEIPWEEYLARFSALCPLLPAQIVHRDPNPDNILLADGRVVGFLDFDLSRILPRIFDIAYAATGVLADAFPHVEAGQRMAFFDVARALREGYDAHTPLTEAEWQALPDMTIAIQCICVAAFSGKEKFAQLAETNRQMLRLILKNTDRLGK